MAVIQQFDVPYDDLGRNLMACGSINIIGLGILSFAIFIVLLFFRKEFSGFWFKFVQCFFLFMAIFYTLHENIGSCSLNKVYFSFLPTEWDLMGVVVFVLKMVGLG